MFSMPRIIIAVRVLIDTSLFNASYHPVVNTNAIFFVCSNLQIDRNHNIHQRSLVFWLPIFISITLIRGHTISIIIIITPLSTRNQNLWNLAQIPHIFLSAEGCFCYNQYDYNFDQYNLDESILYQYKYIVFIRDSLYAL